MSRPWALPFPLRGFAYELRRALVSWPLLALLVLFTLVSFGVLSSVASTTEPTVGLNLSSVYYYTAGAYHVDLYADQQSGAPYAGVYLNMTFSKPNGLGGWKLVANASGTTGSSGLLELTATLPEQPYNVTVSDEIPNAGGQWIPLTLEPPPSGVAVPFFLGMTGVVQELNNFVYTPRLQVLYPGPNGTLSGDLQVYWAGPFNASTNAPATQFPTLPESSMHFLGVLNAITQAFPLQLAETAPPAETQFEAPIIQVEVFSNSGRFLAKDTNASALPFYAKTTSTIESEGTTAIFGYGGTTLDVLVPLMAILVSYTVYARDRVTGVLDATLSGPVSRLGLALSRYLAVVVALTLAVALTTLVLDLLIHWSLGVYLPTGTALAILGVFVLVGATFATFLVLVARVTRSTASVLGIGLGLFGLFVIVWGVLVNFSLLGAEPSSFQSSKAAQLTVQLNFLNPDGLLNLAEVAGSGAHVPGVTTGAVVADGVLWLAVPLALFLLHVRYRD